MLGYDSAVHWEDRDGVTTTQGRTPLGLNIEVIEIRFSPEHKTVKAFVDIRIGDWIVRDWRVIKEKGKRPWVASPQTSWKRPSGGIQYKTVVTLPDELKGQVDLAILERFTEEAEKKANDTPDLQG